MHAHKGANEWTGCFNMVHRYRTAIQPFSARLILHGLPVSVSISHFCDLHLYLVCLHVWPRGLNPNVIFCTFFLQLIYPQEMN